jgi:hypothetical protein
MTGEPPYVLVTNDKHGRAFSDTAGDLAPKVSGQVSSLGARNTQRTGEHHNLAKQWTFWIAFAPRGRCITRRGGAANRFANPRKPVVHREARTGTSRD